MFHKAILATSLAWALSCPCAAQSIEAVPRQFTGLPGNAAVSMPLRWERGLLQVIYRDTLLPPGLAGKTVTAISIRRPGFVDEPAYGPVQRTIRIWMASTVRTTVTRNTQGNFTGNPVEVLPPTPISVAASQPTGPGDAVGATLVTFQLTTPFTVGTNPNLFVQFEVSGPSFGLSPDHWIDGVWLPGGEGLAVAVGNGGCSPVPGAVSRLEYTSAEPPGAGRPLALAASGFPPLAPVFFVGRANPQNPVGPGALTPGFGRPFGGAAPPNCFSWAEPDFYEFGFSDGAGAATWSTAIPPGFPGGREFGFQAVCIPDLATLVPWGTNGIAIITNPVGVGAGASTAMSTEVPPFPPPANPTASYTATFLPFVGLAPILLLHLQ